MNISLIHLKKCDWLVRFSLSLLVMTVLFGCATSRTIVSPPAVYSPPVTSIEKVADHQEKVRLIDKTRDRLLHKPPSAGASLFRGVNTLFSIANNSTEFHPSFFFHLNAVPEGAVVKRAILCLPVQSGGGLEEGSFSLDIYFIERSLVIDKLHRMDSYSPYSIRKSHVSRGDKELWAGTVGGGKMLSFSHWSDVWKEVQLNPKTAIYASSQDDVYKVDVTNYVVGELRGDGAVTFLISSRDKVDLVFDEPYIMVDYDIRASSSDSNNEDVVTRLGKLKELHTNGVITDSEYNEKRGDILNDI